MPGVANPLNGVDQKIVAAEILNLLDGAEDFTTDFRSDFTAPINGQKASTVVVRLKPVVTLATMPDASTRDGLLPRTSVSSGSVEVSLTDDKYFKLAVDDQGIEPEQTSRELGEAGGDAIVQYSTDNLLATLSGAGATTGANKNTVALGATAAAATATQVWDALVTAVAELKKARYTRNFALYVDIDAWSKLIKGDATLRTAVNPQDTAASLLGVNKVRETSLAGANDVAVVAHRSAVVTARVLSGIREGQEDFDSIVEGRVKIGTKVLDQKAIRIVRSTAA